MKRLFLGAVLAALCSVPAWSRAETPGDALTVAAPADTAQGRRASTEPTQDDRDEANDLAAREKAAPQLAEFSGGGDGVYITSGAIIVALLVVLLLVAL